MTRKPTDEPLESVGVDEDRPELLTARDVARMLSVSPVQIWRLDKAGQIPEPVRISDRVVRWRRRELVDWCYAGCPSRDAWREFEWKPSFVMRMSAFIEQQKRLATEHMAIAKEAMELSSRGQEYAKVYSADAYSEPKHRRPGYGRS
jgi:predicted DNA-binding transcriptional regulator AlpA